MRLILVALLFGSVIFFGGVHVWVYSLTALAVYGLGFIAVCQEGWSNLRGGQQRGVALDFRAGGWAALCLAVLLGICLIQLVPLPPALIEALSPRAWELKKMALEISGKKSGWVPLSLVPYETKIIALKLTMYLTFFLLTVSSFRTSSQISTAVTILICGSALISMYGIVEAFSGHEHILWWEHEWQDGTRVFGTFINPNHFGFFLGLVTPLSLGYLYHRLMTRKKRRVHQVRPQSTYRRVIALLSDPNDWLQVNALYAFMVSILVLTLFFTGSRGAILASAGAITVMAGILFYKTRSKAFVLVLALCFLFAAFYAHRMGSHMVFDRFASISMDKLTLTGRIHFAISVLPMLQDFMWAGTGLGTFSQVFPMVQPEEFHKLLRHLHNDWLELILEAGVFAFILAVSGLALVLRSVVQGVRQRSNSLSVGLGAGLAGSLVFAALHSLMDFSLHMPGNALTLLFVLGLGGNALRVHRRGGRARGQRSGDN